MTGFDDRSPYSLLYVDGWDHELNEPLGGGRCLGEYETQAEALHAHDCFAASAGLMWGPGHLAVADAQGRLAFSATLAPPSGRCCPACAGTGKLPPRQAVPAGHREWLAATA